MGTMRHVGGRTQAAMFSGALVFAGGITGVTAAEESKASHERGRVGAVELMEQARAKEQAPLPVAAEVKALVVTGTVMDIDREARSVILRDELSGEEVTVQVPPDATSFDQLKVGDRIDVNMLQPLELAPPKPE
jgi:hypothetical protein